MTHEPGAWTPDIRLTPVVPQANRDLMRATAGLVLAHIEGWLYARSAVATPPLGSAPGSARTL